MDKNQYILTLGQASCLALSLPPTDENRKAAKRIFSESVFEVTYLQDANPMTPVAIGKNAKMLNPFLYNSYPETPPASPIHIHAAEEQEDEAIAFVEIGQDYNAIEKETNGSREKAEQQIETWTDKRADQEPETDRVIASRRRGRSAKNPITQSTKASTAPPFGPVKKSTVAKAHLSPQNKTTFKINAPVTRRRNDIGKKNIAAAVNITSAIPSQSEARELSSHPPVSRTKANNSTAPANKNTATLSQNEAISSPSSINDDNKQSVSKSKVLNYLKLVLHTRVPVESGKYDPLFVTSADQMEIVKEHFDVNSTNEKNPLDQKKLAGWVGKADFLSYPTTFNGLRGRWLYVLKKECRDEIVLQK